MVTAAVFATSITKSVLHGTATLQGVDCYYDAAASQYHCSGCQPVAGM
jgi:hypothetical protein